jgi:hypothetical protein
MVRRGRRFESVRGLREVAAYQLLLLAKWATVLGLDVHRTSTSFVGSPSAGLRNAVGERVYGLGCRRPPSVHRSYDRERVEQRNGVFTAVTVKVSKT